MVIKVSYGQSVHGKEEIAAVTKVIKAVLVFVVTDGLYLKLTVGIILIVIGSTNSGVILATV